MPATISVGTIAMLCVSQASGTPATTGRAGQPGADPQLVGREPAHDHRVAVEAVRQEGHEPVARQALQGASHGCRPLQHAGGLGQQPDADDQEDRADRHRQAELAQVARPVWISA